LRPFGQRVERAAHLVQVADPLRVQLGHVPFGVHALLASYIRKDDLAAFTQDASQIALGYRYTLSKRTDLNVAIAKIDNRNGASYTVGSAIESGSGRSWRGSGTRSEHQARRPAPRHGSP
jgi:hypothetical protein